MYETEGYAFLKETIAINTVKDNEKTIADRIEHILLKHDIKSEQIEFEPNRNALIATIEGKEAGPTLAFSGHMDVVPVGDLEWDTDPFIAVEKNGFLYGRGTADMKAGVSALLTAAIRIKEDGGPQKGRLKLVFTPGEEQGGIGAKKLVDLGYLKDVDACIIGEPSSNGIIRAHKGVLWTNFITYGKTAHGSIPALGNNAVERMLDFLTIFKERFNLEQAHDELLGHCTVNVTVFNGGKSVNVIPDKASVDIDIRTVPGQSHEEIYNNFRALIDELRQKDENFKIEMSNIATLLPLRTADEHPLVQQTQNIIKKITGKDKALSTLPGGTDGSEFVRANPDVAVIILGPGDFSMAHQPNEYVEIKDFYDAINIYEQAATLYLS